MTDTKAAETATYADRWADAINETYDEERNAGLLDFDLTDDEFGRAMEKAAECLRYGRTHTFNGAELDAIRYFMPAHEVHQSDAARCFLRWFGRPVSAIAEDERVIRHQRLENLLDLEERIGEHHNMAAVRRAMYEVWAA